MWLAIRVGLVGAVDLRRTLSKDQSTYKSGLRQRVETQAGAEFRSAPAS